MYANIITRTDVGTNDEIFPGVRHEDLSHYDAGKFEGRIMCIIVNFEFCAEITQFSTLQVYIRLSSTE